MHCAAALFEHVSDHHRTAGEGWCVVRFVGHGVPDKRGPVFPKNLAHLLSGLVSILEDLLPLETPRRQTGEAGG